MSSPHPNPVVERLAQRRFELESLLEAQSAVIRKEPGGYQAAYERNQDGFAKQPGDRWIPADDVDKEKMIKKMEEMRAKTPTSIDDRMKIVFAAHGLLMYIVRLDMNELPMDTQLQIGKRTLELHREVLPPMGPAQAEMLVSDSKQQPLARPSTLPPTRPVTALDVELFEADRFKIVGMSFIRQESDEEVFYEVAEIGLSKKEVWYQVHFEGCAEYIQIDQEQMMAMVKDSLMLEPASTCPLL